MDDLAILSHVEYDFREKGEDLPLRIQNFGSAWPSQEEPFLLFFW